MCFGQEPQLDEIAEPPNIDPFAYRPVERGQRSRMVQRPSRRPLSRQQTISEEDIDPASQRLAQQPPVGTHVPQGPQIDTVVQQPLQQAISIPSPGSVIPEILTTTPTAPTNFGGTGQRDPSRAGQRRQQPPRPTTSADIPIQQAASQQAGQSQEPNIHRQYVPMPPGPTTVQLPPVFDSLMEILRENRLAQLATVDQQRELTRYMRGLNEWLERDAYDRRSELQGVVACVEQLSHDIRGIRAQEGTSSGSDDTSTIYEHGPGFPQPAPELYPRFPQPSLRYPPVIPPVVPGTT